MTYFVIDILFAQLFDATMPDSAVLLAILTLASLWFWFNRGFIRSFKARRVYRNAVVSLNEWLSKNSGVCPCAYYEGRELKEAVILSYKRLLSIPHSTGDPEYVKYLENFHATGCDRVQPC